MNAAGCLRMRWRLERALPGYLREHAGSSIPAALEALLGLLGALGVQGPGRDLLLMLVRRRRT